MLPTNCDSYFAPSRLSASPLPPSRSEREAGPLASFVWSVLYFGCVFVFTLILLSLSHLFRLVF